MGVREVEDCETDHLISWSDTEKRLHELEISKRSTSPNPGIPKPLLTHRHENEHHRPLGLSNVHHSSLCYDSAGTSIQFQEYGHNSTARHNSMQPPVLFDTSNHNGLNTETVLLQQVSTFSLPTAEFDTLSFPVSAGCNTELSYIRADKNQLKNLDSLRPDCTQRRDGDRKYEPMNHPSPLEMTEYAVPFQSPNEVSQSFFALPGESGNPHFFSFPAGKGQQPFSTLPGERGMMVQTPHGPALLFSAVSKYNFETARDIVKSAARESQPPSCYRKFQRWSDEEDEILQEAVEAAGNPPYNWKRIASKHFANRRSPLQCKTRWTKVCFKRFAGNVPRSMYIV